ncbi:MAG: hypothetical protein Q9M26_01675 [Mariprofundales bacterium]|nr:hypothetical protein [Mariprofundales bacterium]
MTVDFQDGWTIYIWLASGVLILVAVVFGIRWATKNEQFDEDIKYLVFDENDEDRMSADDFAKFKEVQAYQEKRRQEFLQQLEEEAKLD